MYLWSRLEYFSWKGTNHLVQWPDQFRAGQQFKHAVKDIAKILKINRFGTLTISLGSLFHHLSPLWVEKWFLVPSLTSSDIGLNIPMNWIQDQVIQFLLVLLKAEGKNKPNLLKAPAFSQCIFVIWPCSTIIGPVFSLDPLLTLTNFKKLFLPHPSTGHGSVMSCEAWPNFYRWWQKDWH